MPRVTLSMVSGDWTPARAKEEGIRLFGSLFNIFRDMHRKRWYVGKFLTEHDRWQRNPDGSVRLNEDQKPIEAHPATRRQVIYGSGETLEEAFRFSRGGRAMVGYRPVYKNGELKAFETAGGLRVKELPKPLPETLEN